MISSLSFVSPFLLSLGSAFAMFASTPTDEFRAPACSGPGCDPVCVEPGRYVASALVVIDDNDGKRWQRDTPVHLSQKDAVAYCDGLDLGGVTGWRLPDAEELEALEYKAAGLGAGHAAYCMPAIDQAAFPATPSEPFWTTRTGDNDTGWYVGFDDGRAHWSPTAEEFAVRCVHDEPAPTANP